MHRAAYALLVFAMSGCVTTGGPDYKPANISLPDNQAGITFYSEPAGATISENSKVFGSAPITVNWNLGPSVSQGKPITATWVSGATSTFTPKLVGGKPQFYVFKRPANHPNEQQDLAFATKFGTPVQSAANSTTASPDDSDKWLKVLEVFLGGAAAYQQGKNSVSPPPAYMYDSPPQPERKQKPAEPPSYNCQPNVIGTQINCTPRPW